MAGVWKDALQWPVERSQVLTTPSESLEIAMPSLACRVMDFIGAEVGGVDLGLLATRFVDGAPICQNLIDWSSDAEMREEEENVREMMS